MKTMNKLYFLLFILLSMPLALAQETMGSDIEVTAGILPSSPWYGLDRAIERLSLRLIPENERPFLRLQYIKERNEEMFKETREDKILLAKANQDEDLEAIELEAEKLPKEQAKLIEDGLQKSLERLQYLLSLKPASKGLQNAITAHDINIERVNNKIKAKS